MTALVVRVLGAESTGKSTLCHALGELAAQHGVRCAVVSEYLRVWCEAGKGAQGLRLPQQHDQFHIARRQQRRIALAARQADLVIADTCGLMTRVYSAHFFGHDLPAQGPVIPFDLTLVSDTDIPWQPDPLRDGPVVRTAVHQRLLAALAQQGHGFMTVSGPPHERLKQAWSAINRFLHQEKPEESS